MSTLTSRLPDRAKDDRSCKQVILDLWQRDKTIGELQARGLSAAHNALRTRGIQADEALRVVFAEYDDGNLTFPGGTKVAQVIRPTVDMADADLNAKSKLIWLHREGTISERELRLAAALLDKLQAEGNAVSDLLLKYALAHVGATQALTAADRADYEKPKPIVTGEPVNIPPAPPALVVETEREVGMDETGAEALLAAALDACAKAGLPDILAVNVDEARIVVMEQDTWDNVAMLQAVESLNPKYEGGRHGVLEMIDQQLDNLAPDGDTDGVDDETPLET